MTSASTADGTSSISDPPNLPAASANTSSRRHIDAGEESSWVFLLLALAFPFSWRR
jgi:hypothetical protein